MEYKHECNICFNDDICENNIVYMDCLHYMCFNCFRNLLTSKCPFCRSEIDLSKYDSIGLRINQIRVVNESLDDIFVFEAEYDDNEQYDDFVIPIIKKNRHELKRHRNLKKKEKLENILKSTLSFSNFPNIKNRSIRRILNKLNTRLSSSY